MTGKSHRRRLVWFHFSIVVEPQRYGTPNSTVSDDFYHVFIWPQIGNIPCILEQTRHHIFVCISCYHCTVFLQNGWLSPWFSKILIPIDLLVIQVESSAFKNGRKFARCRLGCCRKMLQENLELGAGVKAMVATKTLNSGPSIESIYTAKLLYIYIYTHYRNIYQYIYTQCIYIYIYIHYKLCTIYYLLHVYFLVESPKSGDLSISVTGAAAGTAQWCLERQRFPGSTGGRGGAEKPRGVLAAKRWGIPWDIPPKMDHRNSGFSHETWWLSIVMLVYQRVLVLYL